MTASSGVVMVCLAFAAGAALAWLIARAHAVRLYEQWQSEVRRAGEHRNSAEQSRVALSELHAKYVEAEQRCAAAEARSAEAGETQRHEIAAIAQQLKAELHEANSRIVQMQREQFLELAGQRFSAAEERANAKLTELVGPVSQKLTEFDALVRQVERQRHGADETLKEQIAGLMSRTDRLDLATNALSSQTSVLVQALKNPATRGKWGEVQLRRVVELAGMVPYCDFSEQQSFESGDALSRPDLTVALPGDTLIFVDAKVPLNAYLDAIDATDESVRKEKLRLHAAAMKSHVDALARKQYQRASDSADFVLMFVPGEAFLSAACTENPDLIEHGAAKGVYIASPLTLIALLRSYALGWQQKRQEENAKKIAEMGRELYDRVRIFAQHFSKLGASLTGAIGAYNSAVGSLETRVLPQGRRLKEVAALPDAEIPEALAVEIAPRDVTALDAAPASERRPRQKRLEFPPADSA